MHRPTHAASAAVLVLLASCATAPTGTEADAAASDADSGDCFSVRMVKGYSVVERDTVRLEIGPRRAYEVDTRGAACHDLRWANTIAVRTYGSSFLCVGDDVRDDARIVSDRGDSCIVEAVRRAPEEPEDNGEAAPPAETEEIAAK